MIEKPVTLRVCQPCFSCNKKQMDTIRTLYVSADQAVKTPSNTYELNLVGGISVAEGSRVYVDNIAMVNNVCEEVDEKTTKYTWELLLPPMYWT